MVKFETKYDNNAQKLANIERINGNNGCLILSILFTVLGLLFIIGAEDYFDLVFGIVYMLVFGLGFCPLVKGLTLLMVKSYSKTELFIGNDTVQVYELDENGVKIQTTKSDVFYEETKLAYSMIYKVRETATYFALYISRAKIAILEKDKITEGSAKELREILKKHYGSAFKEYDK